MPASRSGRPWPPTGSSNIWAAGRHALVRASGSSSCSDAVSASARRCSCVTAVPAGAQVGKDIEFFSEGVVCHGRMFVPAGFSAGRARRPAVVLAPGAGDTASVDRGVCRASGVAGHRRPGDRLPRLGPERRLHLHGRTDPLGRPAALLAAHREGPAAPQAPDARRADHRHPQRDHLPAGRARRRPRPHRRVGRRSGRRTRRVGGRHGRQGQGRRRARAGDRRQGSGAGRVEADRRRAGRARQAGALRPSVGDRGHGGHGQRPGGAPRARRVPPVQGARRDSADHRRAVRRGREGRGGEATKPHAVAASKVVKGPTGVTTIPGAAHAMSGPAADAAATAAAAWFAKHLVVLSRRDDQSARRARAHAHVPGAADDGRRSGACGC